jgi:hypothetical protein
MRLTNMVQSSGALFVLLVAALLASGSSAADGSESLTDALKAKSRPSSSSMPKIAA